MSGLIARPAGIHFDLDQVAAGTAPDVAVGKDQAALAAVERLHATCVVAVLERDPALAGFVAVMAIWLAVHGLLPFLRGHSEAQLSEAAGGRRLPDGLARPAAIHRSGLQPARRVRTPA